jgi:hypothetical protein
LKLAARIIASRDDFPENDRDGALAAIFALTPEFGGKAIEDYFPSLMVFAVTVAGDLCVKYMVNQMVQSMRAPKIYDESMIRWLFKEFVDVATDFLEISVGRPSEIDDHIKAVEKALASLENKGQLKTGQRPTQEQVACELSIDARSLRKWADGCGLSWNEFLRACGWTIKAERN